MNIAIRGTLARGIELQLKKILISEETRTILPIKLQEIIVIDGCFSTYYKCLTTHHIYACTTASVCESQDLLILPQDFLPFRR